MRKHYINSRTGEDTNRATLAMEWHRAGDMVQVNTFYNELHKTGLANVVHIPGATAKTGQEKTYNANRAHCKHIAQELEAYAAGTVYRCPDCGEEIRLPDDVGDKFKCPHCGTVSDVDDLEPLSVWDYMSDVLDIEYRTGGRNADDLRSVRVMVACGGPNIYIDTATASVELYWWGDRASYPISYDARDAVDEWAQELWSC